MESTVVNGLLTLKVNMYLLVALGVIAYYIGVAVRATCPFFVKLSIPAPVLGGLPFAIAAALLEYGQVVAFNFDGTLQTALLIVFFCTIGMNASISLLSKGVLLIAAFLAISTVGAILQNFLGMGVISIFGLDPRIGIVGGGVALTGGLGTAGAFGPQFEQWGLAGATAIGVACATFGMVVGSMTGGPFAEFVMKLHKVKTPHIAQTAKVETTEEAELSFTADNIMKNLAWVLVLLLVST